MVLFTRHSGEYLLKDTRQIEKSLVCGGECLTGLLPLKIPFAWKLPLKSCQRLGYLLHHYTYPVPVIDRARLPPSVAAQHHGVAPEALNGLPLALLSNCPIYTMSITPRALR